MKRKWLSTILAANVALVGCLAPRSPETGQQATEAVATSPDPQLSANMAAVMAGMWLGAWHCQARNLRLTLAPDGRFEGSDWQVKDEDVSGFPKISARWFKGKWFNQDGTLVLRVETGSRDLSLGLELTFLVKSVSAQTMVLYDALTKEQLTFKRLPGSRWAT